jgi:hypothetical protein
MQRKEIIIEIKKLITINGNFVYGKTLLSLPLCGMFYRNDKTIKQYVSTVYDDRVMVIDTIDGEHKESNYVDFFYLITPVLKNILNDICTHYNLEKPNFTDFEIDYSRLFSETRLNISQEKTLCRMIFLISNGGLKAYIDQRYNILEEEYSKWYNTSYLDVILNEINEKTFLYRLMNLDPTTYFQDCNLYNFEILLKENLTEHFNFFETDFRGRIVTVHRFDGEIIIETFVKRNRENEFYNIKDKNQIWGDLTTAYISGKNKKYVDVIINLIESK